MDLLISNAQVLTDEGLEDSLGIDDGKIAYIGREKNVSAKIKIDLQGNVVLPGFVDSHVHLDSLGEQMLGLDLSSTRSREEAIELAIKYAERTDEHLIIGRGWDESLWEDKTYLRKEDVDRIGKPTVLVRIDDHMAVANSAALRIMGLEERRDGIIREGELKMLRKIRPMSEERIAMYLECALRSCLSQGITSVRDIVDSLTFRAYSSVKSDVRVKLAVYTEDFDQRMVRNENFWGVKVFLDGSIGSATAAFSGWESDNLIYTEREFLSLVEEYSKMGVRVAAHAIGDVAIELALRVFGRNAAKTSNSIEHFELPRDEFFDMLDDIYISCQPNFLQWSGEGGLYERRLGKFWVERNNPYRLLVDRGAKLAFGSDCMPLGPSYGIGLAVNSPHPRQRLNVIEAINCYTKGGATLLGVDRLCGCIKPGLSADLAIFDAYYLKDGQRIRDKKPLATLVGGKVAYGTLKLP